MRQLEDNRQQSLISTAGSEHSESGDCALENNAPENEMNYFLSVDLGASVAPQWTEEMLVEEIREMRCLWDTSRLALKVRKRVTKIYISKSILSLFLCS